jgi:hypothetical protein
MPQAYDQVQRKCFTMIGFSTLRRLLIAPILLASAFPSFWPRRAQTITKISVRGVEPAREPGCFEAQPKTYWRAGKKYARIAEAEDPKNAYGLAVIAEPERLEEQSLR